MRELFADAKLGLSIVEMVGRQGDSAQVIHNRIQRVGLALAGHFHGVVPSRVQVCGETEISYLKTMTSEQRSAALGAFLALQVCSVVVTGGLPLPEEMIEQAERNRCLVVRISERTGHVIQAIEGYLDERLAPRMQLHGVLVDVFGVGMLLLGKSGIGKSECALDLVLRGHRLVADDWVLCDFRHPGHVFGAPASLLRHLIEVRGLGILNVKTLFGVTAVRDRKRIDIIVRLCSATDEPEQERLGIEDRFHELLGVKIREIALPVRAGRDMAAIVEIAARDELSRRAGHHSAKEFYDTIERRLQHEGNS
ncbi:MAG TPA: HPr(Ser) kinase/phosphatase [Polyangiaceae bacterium]|nr:MAG: HPr kinase/phosphorylase [Deltaproteobacteria bacterium ADurb.Bin207]HNS97006.1 HPr(Ser) kinase/phosphatase [Polyangiaceae bacterium]HNZ23353.1 HPr(Ser) kinase/phosphatase [Polyangiaceae bacterium]HOD25151.1 HPr(Ser) kinase/phosphatase [Polyangiaceae bacterium]HOE50175.1 HPr(Ser) kinase/phosphatase [Polyangiaceae bacterium]